MIQTSYKDDRGELVELSHNDAKYWEGPYKYVPFPKMVFRITRPGQTEPDVLIVKSESELERAGTAWKETPDDALAHFNALESEVARAAAESNFADRSMSEKAKAERLTHERATDEMVTDVPRKGRS